MQKESLCKFQSGKTCQFQGPYDGNDKKPSVADHKAKGNKASNSLICLPAQTNIENEQLFYKQIGCNKFQLDVQQDYSQKLGSPLNGREMLCYKAIYR